MFILSVALPVYSQHGYDTTSSKLQVTIEVTSPPSYYRLHDDVTSVAYFRLFFFYQSNVPHSMQNLKVTGCLIFAWEAYRKFNSFNQRYQKK